MAFFKRRDAMPKAGDRTIFGELLAGGYAIFKPDEGTCEKPFLVYVKTGENEAKALMTHFEFRQVKEIRWDEVDSRPPYFFEDSVPVTVLIIANPPPRLGSIIRLNRRFRKK